MWAEIGNGLLIGPFILPNQMSGMEYLIFFLENILPELLGICGFYMKEFHHIFEWKCGILLTYYFQLNGYEKKKRSNRMTPTIARFKSL